MEDEHNLKPRRMRSLEDLCIRWLSRNLSKVVYEDKEGGLHFYLSRFFLSSHSAELLIKQLAKHDNLEQETLQLFSRDNVEFTKPEFIDCPYINDLSFLSKFCLRSLTVSNTFKVTMEHALNDCVSQETLRTLACLNLSHQVVIINGNCSELMNWLARFQNLRMLNVSCTTFNSTCLEVIAESLPNLVHLNISATAVHTISPLKAMGSRLLGLMMYGLELRSSNAALETIVKHLTGLCKLDISRHIGNEAPNEKIKNMFILESSHPNMEYLDMSGNWLKMENKDIMQYVVNHPHLKFLGLAKWNEENEYMRDCFDSIAKKNPHIKVTGDRGDLLLNSLLQYKERSSYVKAAFCHIFEETRDIEEPNAPLLKAVLKGMARHRRDDQLILAGSAVVYNLTRESLGPQLPAYLLNRAIEEILCAMEDYPGHQQLQKNCFLTLCSDCVLQKVKFNYNRCCKIVFDGMYTLNDPRVARMGVAIISILAAEITTAELSRLAAKCGNVRKLVELVATRALPAPDLQAAPEGSYLRFVEAEENAPLCDATLKYTLSALWNITDECPVACEKFVEENGLFVYHRVFVNFRSQDYETRTHIYTKCLGLLNNFAEVPLMRQTLLAEKHLMEHFIHLLNDPSIHVSYFAAGIIAHLSCESDEVWLQAKNPDKEMYIAALERAVVGWEPSQADMVAYRSFQPFQALIDHPMESIAVRLWATWAMHHVISRKDSRYIPLLEECPSLIRFLQSTVTSHEETSSSPAAQKLRDLSSSILGYLKSSFEFL